MPKIENLYPNSENQAKRVENPSSRRSEISTQMGGKTAEKVENPSAAGWKSLPKSGKSAEKGRETQ